LTTPAHENVWVVILAGGVGSRFWPLSTPERPKQLLPLVTDKPLLVDQLERLAPLIPLKHTLVLTRESLVTAILEAAPQLSRTHIIAEPKQIGTAGALAYAAMEIERRSAGKAKPIMVCVHADWAIAQPEEFRATLTRAMEVAINEHALVTVGIVPTRPDTGFGYIALGEPVASTAHRVARFVEKPNPEKAAKFVEQGYLWNSGIFVWRVEDFLAEVRALTPEVAPALSDIDTFFDTVKPISIDHGVLERSSKVMVIPGDFGWDDIGTWEALDRIHPGRAAKLKASVLKASVESLS
jgi:mannose-1-phosphate guanylyltransferase